MAEDKALLQAIVEDPDDDLPRLAYADWLEEHGDETQLARAEFIRAQVALSRMADDDPARPALTVREATLLRAHGDLWRRDVAKLADFTGFQRGFVHLAILTLPKLLRHGEKLLDRAPVTELQLSCGGDDDPRELARWPGLARVRGLDLTQMMICQPGVRDVFQSPRASGLRRLSLAQIPFGLEAGRWLRDATSLESLRELRLRGLPLDDDGFQHLLQAPWFANLTRLDLSHNRLTTRAVEALVAHWPPGLVELDLTSVQLGDEGADLLARCRCMAGLKTLALTGTQIRPDGLAALVRSPYLEGLTSLDVRSNSLGTAGARLLAEAPRLAGLTRLAVGFSASVGDAAITQLANSRYLRRLCWLDLSTGVRADGAAALANSPVAATLTHLDLSNNPIGEKGAKALAESRQLRRLTHVLLSNAQLRNRGICALAESPILTNVVGLDLRGNGLDESGAAALATSPSLGPHATLILSHQNTGKKILRDGFVGRVEYR